MSKKSVVIEYLDLLKAAEKEAADLYSYISQSVSASNPELAKLFQELSQEEIVHARYFDMLKDYQAGSEELFLATGDTPATVAAALAEIRKKSDAICFSKKAIPEKELIKAALFIENGVMEKHAIYAVRITDESLRKLFKSLEFADAGHVERLKKYLAEHDKN
jgi:rubrerythrin